MRDLSQPRDFNVRAAPYLGNGGLSWPSVNYQGPLLMLRRGSEWEEEERRRNQQIFQQTIAHIQFLRDLGFRPNPDGTTTLRPEAPALLPVHPCVVV